MYAEQTAVSTDRLNVFEGGGSPRIHAGKERFSSGAMGSENPAVNEIVEFVHANPCVDVHQDGT
jgi:hypothetical protein